MNPTVCFNLYSTPTARPNNLILGSNEALCVGVNNNGTDMSVEELLDTWNVLDCPLVFTNIIYPTNGEGQLVYSSIGYERAETDMEYLLSKYYLAVPGGHNLVLPGQIGYSNFQENLLQICTAANGLPTDGICNSALKKLCFYCNREEISNNTNLLRMCGCYAPNLDPTIYPDIPKKCDSLCSQNQVAKLREPITGEVQLCNTGGVCVINNVSISASKSAVGGVSFTQVCPQCTQFTSCKCIVDVSIPNTAAQVGLNNPTTFNQYCGNNSQCIVIDNVTNTSTTVPCQTNIDALQPTVYDYPVPVTIWVIVFLIVIVFIFTLIAWKQGYSPIIK